MRYVPATVGVVSWLSKDVRVSSIGVVLKACSLHITSIKIDPYLNTNAGTMHPFKHGKAFMLDDDGDEVGLDLGNCERFLDIKLTRDSNGKIFQSLIDKGRKGEYLGKTLQIVPHITNAIQDGIKPVAMIPVDGMDGPGDVCVIELGGTIHGHEFNTEDLSAPLLNGRHQSLIRLHLRNEKESRFPLSKGSLSGQSSQARKVLPCLPLCFVRQQHACTTVLHRALCGLCTTAPSKAPHEPMSPSELDTISMLIPRLISKGHVPAAGRLLSAALLLGSTDRLPFSPLAEHLASLPTLIPAFALLTALHHHPVRPSALPLATPLLGNLLSMRHARDAASVFRWLCRPDSSSRPDDTTYDIAVAGFCRIEDPKNALVALREMAADGVRPSQKLQEAVRDAMLQDARIEEAWALEETMRLPESRKTVELVDKFLGAWED